MSTFNDKTQAIVLTTVKLNDRTPLVHFYTEQLGRVTCSVPMVARGKQASRLRNMMTPMTLLELDLGGRPSDHIRTIVEANIVQSPYMLTLTHPDKAAQCIYMAELLAHTVREEERNARLWDFLVGSLTVLYHCDEGWGNHHLVFTCGLIFQLGFGIDTEAYTPGCCFDMREAVFTSQDILHPYYLNPESAHWFCRIFDERYDTMHQLALTHTQRSSILDMLLAYLALQIPEMGQLHSVEVLKTLYC